VLIDQHAAHERVVFERLRTERRRRKIVVQPLLLPAPIELDPSRSQVAADHREHLRELGFELEPFGGETWMLKSTPAALRCSNLVGLIRDLLDELKEVEVTTALDEQADHLLSCVACHSVVRAGERLDKEEMRTLLRDMDEIDFGAHCPHGRPVFVEWSAGELARLFHRT